MENQDIQKEDSETVSLYIFADNYRGFDKAFIPVEQVNFLVGENSTGKTSILDLIEILSEPTFWYFTPDLVVQGHPRPHFQDLISASSSQKNKTFTVGALEINKETNLNCGMLVSYKEVDGNTIPHRVTTILGRSVRTVCGELRRGRENAIVRHRSKELSKTAEIFNPKKIVEEIVGIHFSNQRLAKVAPSRIKAHGPFFMRFEEFLYPPASDSPPEGAETPSRIPLHVSDPVATLAPIRTKPKRTYDAPQTEYSPEGDHTPYVIKRYLASKTEAENFKSFLNAAGASSGLFKEVKVRQYGSSPVAPFEMKIVLGKTALGVANVGYGVSQALPVLVEMFSRAKGSTITIQQPEVHLHPKAQATIGDLVAQFARTDNKIFFIETHSDFTIDRFRINIRNNGPISSQLLFFQRVGDKNVVTPIMITHDGSLSEDQPEEYRDFFLNESLSLL